MAAILQSIPKRIILRPPYGSRSCPQFYSIMSPSPHVLCTWHQPCSPYSSPSDNHTQHESYDLIMPPSSLPLGFCSFCLEHPSDEISMLNTHKFSNGHLTLLFLWETLPQRLSNMTPQPLKPKIPLSASCDSAGSSLLGQLSKCLYFLLVQKNSSSLE